MEQKLTHINGQGRAKMVDVSQKSDTPRIGVAAGRIQMKQETFALLSAGQIKKGDVLATAQVAGIMAAKKTWEIIPMCHPLLLTGVDLTFTMHPEAAEIEAVATVRTTGKTGIEMEALHAVTVALLTIYDMCKAIDRDMAIKDIYLLEKDGGKSGHYRREGIFDEEDINNDRKEGGLMTNAIVHSICIAKERGQLKKEVQQVEILKNEGLFGDGHCGQWDRQVTCLNWESVLKSNQEHSLLMGPGDFAENICIENMAALDLQVGDCFQLGETAVLKVSQIGKPDHPSVVTRTFGVTLLPFEGRFCRVLEGGIVNKGDRVTKL